MQSSIIPSLTSTFESLFSVTLTDESSTIRDVLSQIDAKLFASYVDPLARKLDGIVHAGVTSPGWVPESARPNDARPYIYEVLLELVGVHAETSTISTTLTTTVLKTLLERISQSLIAAFQTRARYTLPALMQATLDVEFLAQTLNNYTTDKASEVQSGIYVSLDERTDNDARVRLQNELGEMRGVLKRLRQSTQGEFGCFKRMRSGGAGASGRAPSRP